MKKKEKEINEAVTKAVSELKFSDFMSSGHVYKHDSKDTREALGMQESDVKMLCEKMMSEFKSDTNDRLSKCIEGCLKIDLPAPWKAFGFMKLGEGTIKGHLSEVIKAAPDDLPVPILKGVLLMALHAGGI